MTQNIDLSNLEKGFGYKIIGSSVGDKAGFSVSSLGDLNGDGYDDFIIGSPEALSSKGVSYIIFGNSNGFQDIDLSNLGSNEGFKVVGAYNYDSGYSVSEAGDINGDGYNDLLIGTHDYPTISTIILFGKSSGYTDIDLSNVDSSQGFILSDTEFLTCSRTAERSIISSAGDINNDGYDDFIIGKPYDLDRCGYISGYDVGISIGKVSVIFGNSAINSGNYQSFEITAGNDFDCLGYSVSSAGDINNDGYDDIVIGDKCADSVGGSSSGISYVIFGKASGFTDISIVSMSASQGFEITGADSYDYSGYSVSSLGDINSDGYDDIIIGAPFADPASGSSAGTSYVLLGKSSSFTDIDLASLTSSQGFKITGANSDDKSGYSVSGAGDINGDGYNDIIIGAPESNTESGASYIIYGKANGFTDVDLSILTASQGFKVIGAESNDNSGLSVSSAGDVNGDACSDIIIGAPGANVNLGGGYLIFGCSPIGLGPSVLPSHSPTGPTNPPISSPPTSSPTNNINIDLTSLSISQGFKIIGSDSSDYSGYSVGGAGDVNGDGYEDVIIGAPEADPNSRSNAGISYIIFGQATGFVDIDLSSLTSSQGFKIIGSESNDESGYSVGGAGDVNGDGYGDIIIGAPQADPDSGSSAGISYVIFGKSSGFVDIDLLSFSSSHGFKITGWDFADDSGWSVGGAGDVNGDGYSDIIIGAPGADPVSGSRAGISYVIFGKSSGFIDIDLGSLTSSQGFKIIGANSGDYSGHSVSSAGDFNGDGYGDIIIGAVGADPNDQSGAGTSYVVFGKSSGFVDINLASIAITQGFKMVGSSSNDGSGHSVSLAGDINEDGYDDIIVGAPGADSVSGASVGISYVIFGKVSGHADIDLASMTSDQGFRIIGANSGDESGYSVASIGDFNGDGYDDVIIGASEADPNENSKAGISYVIFGRQDGFSDIELENLIDSQGFAISGAISGDESGFSVNGAGDVNGDGFADVIIGAPKANPGANSDAGISYVIFGFSTSPTSFPTSFPTLMPSAMPSKLPTNTPTISPTTSPSSEPTKPTREPSAVPSILPTAQPTIVPSSQPSEIPTSFPTGEPSAVPSIMPTFQPTTVPSVEPSGIPTSFPTEEPSGIPSIIPTSEPTCAPSSQPSGIPTSFPTGEPSAVPSIVPTFQPTIIPSSQPSGVPTSFPTGEPSAVPSIVPTFQPTTVPSVEPSGIPTSFPTGEPSAMPSIVPTQPTTVPSTEPSWGPTSFPTGNPSASPSIVPTSQPTIAPSAGPSGISTSSPTGEPSAAPTSHPNLTPSFEPSGQILGIDNPTLYPTVISSHNIYIQKVISNVSNYTGTFEAEDFIIDASYNVKISGGAGDDKFTIIPRSEVNITIADFDPNHEIIDIKMFDNIHGFNDLEITHGSAVVNLPDQQKVVLLNLEPNDLGVDNFIFKDLITSAPSITPTKFDTVDENESYDSSFIIGMSIGVCAGVLFTGLLAYGYNKYTSGFNSKIYVSNDDAELC